MNLIVDSIGENFAVCEDEEGEVHYIEVSRLPEGLKEGSVITIFAGGRIEVNVAETERRRSEILSLQEKLFNE